jgi:hypothetical protein
MKSRATLRFWHLFHVLPAPVQALAVKNYLLTQEAENQRYAGRDGPAARHVLAYARFREAAGAADHRF